MRGFFHKIATFLLASGLALGAAAAATDSDIHVLLADPNGVFHDCPNPAHNSLNASNTNQLSYCAGGVNDLEVIGTYAAIGRVSVATCEVDGVVTDLDLAAGAAGVLFDVDTDTETLYAHPQAAIYNMNPSDDIEVHSGVYRTPGARCDGNCNTHGSDGVCDSRMKCWQASVVAFGMGPNLTDDGYGTSADPAYLRGAVMNSSTDTWDPNGDKNPADSAYPVIFSGDVNDDNNGTTGFDTTTCNATSCSGDIGIAIALGCPDKWGELCAASYEGAATGVEIDSNGDGTINQELNEGPQNADYLIVKDIEFTEYNGGSTLTVQASPRQWMGLISQGRGKVGMDGLVFDHLYFHTNDFKILGLVESNWSVFSDGLNNQCATHTEYKNSYIEQNNRYVYNNDCGKDNRCGCSEYIHDNRILVDITSARAHQEDSLQALGYWKAIDSVRDGDPKQIRFVNNEVIVKDAGGTSSKAIYAALVGNSFHQGLGEFWIYGNIFRRHPSISQNYIRFFQSYCEDPGGWAGDYRLYFFNNTMDLGAEMLSLCGNGTSPGEQLVEANNAWFDMSAAHTDDRYNLIYRAHEYCTSALSTDCIVPADVGFTDWFDGNGTDPATHAGLAAYSPDTGGPLYRTGTCDPDGVRGDGVDYIMGNNITPFDDPNWADIAGNEVDCHDGGSLSIGAIQLTTAACVNTCGNNQTECYPTEVCDGTDLNDETCETQEFDGGTLTCAAGCASFVTTACYRCGDGTCNGPEDSSSCTADCGTATELDATGLYYPADWGGDPWWLNKPLVETQDNRKASHAAASQGVLRIGLDPPTDIADQWPTSPATATVLGVVVSVHGNGMHAGDQNANDRKMDIGLGDGAGALIAGSQYITQEFDNYTPATETIGSESDVTVWYADPNSPATLDRTAFLGGMEILIRPSYSDIWTRQVDYVSAVIYLTVVGALADETTFAICTDDLDNDGDGYPDNQDPDGNCDQFYPGLLSVLPAPSLGPHSQTATSFVLGLTPSGLTVGTTGYVACDRIREELNCKGVTVLDAGSAYQEGCLTDLSTTSGDFILLYCALE